MLLKNTIVASVVMIATFLSVGPLTHVEDMAIKKPLAEFPMKVGQWQGKKDKFDDRIYKALGVDDSVLADYRNKDGDTVGLYVGFYRSQREGDIIHSPKNCMPGSGWKITNTEIEDVEVPGLENGRFKAIKLRMKKGPFVNISLYWFQSRGRFISSEYAQKLYLVIDSMTKHRTDGSFVRLITPVVAGGDEQKALNNLKEFAALIIPLLEQHLPS